MKVPNLESMSSVYEALDPLSHEIRLLRVTRFPQQAYIPTKIDCLLERVSLDNDQVPPYIALSYMWGSNRTLENCALPPVYVNGEPFRVTANLHMALTFLAYAKNEHFW